MDESEELIRAHTRLVIANAMGVPPDPADESRVNALTLKLLSKNPGIALKMFMEADDNPHPEARAE